MQAILIHGMGRTPASLLLLATRLRRHGFTVRLFGYSTAQRFDTCVARLASRVRALDAHERFVLVGHSLGCVFIRAVLPRLEPIRPVACFFLAPPSTVTKAARFFAKSSLYRMLTRDCGRLLADEAFMNSLPRPAVPVRVYAGTAGFKGRFSAFKHEDNDGILAVSETLLDAGDHAVRVPAIHTFIMNCAAVSSDIATTSASLTMQPESQQHEQTMSVDTKETTSCAGLPPFGSAPSARLASCMRLTLHLLSLLLALPSTGFAAALLVLGSGIVTKSPASFIGVLLDTGAWLLPWGLLVCLGVLVALVAGAVTGRFRRLASACIAVLAISNSCAVLTLTAFNLAAEQRWFVVLAVISALLSSWLARPHNTWTENAGASG